MEPRFQDGQIVWVTQERNLKTGDVGIFLYDGDVYCKKLERDAGGVRPVSYTHLWVCVKGFFVLSSFFL